MTIRRRDRRAERGVILVLVLWVFMTLGVLALDFSSYMRDDAMAALNVSDETRGYYVALAGMNRALWENNRERLRTGGLGTQDSHDSEGEAADTDGDGEPDGTEYRADGAWHRGTFGGASYAVRMSGEDGKIPLNVDLSDTDEEALYGELVKFVVTNLVRGGNRTTGVDTKTEQQIGEIVDSILDWRDCDEEARVNGAEGDYYGAQRRVASKARGGGYFDSPDQLLQVRGVTPEIFFGDEESPGLIEIFSAHPRGRELAINAGQITPQVVRALIPAMTMLDAEEFVAGRDEDPESIRMFLVQELEAAVPGLGGRVVVQEPEIVRVEARADLAQERNQASVTAIVQLGGAESDLPVILSWLDRAPRAADGPGAADAPASPADAGPS